jgi:hypothetical protein
MIEFGIFSFLVGAVLGQRFRVMVLLPVTFAMAVLSLLVGLLAQLTFLQGLGDLALCVLALQGGYLFGSMARFWLAAARAARSFPRTVNAAR